MSAVSTPHLVIPFAHCSGDGWLEAMEAQPHRLKILGRLLQGMQPVERDIGEADSLSPPHERVLARARSLVGEADFVDGLIPWAAERAASIGNPAAAKKAWAFLTPCHWAMGREHATMTDPAALGLTPAESIALLEAMQPYFETEGITLHYLAPECWLADGELFRQLPTAALDRVLGRNVDPWLPGAGLAHRSKGSSDGGPHAKAGAALEGKKPAAAARLRRLQNEMQMLLYTHPLNDERSMNRALPVNSFWLSGTGALKQIAQSESDPPQQLTMPRLLADPALNSDWDGYLKAWDQLEAGEIAGLLSRQNAGSPVRLTLCGERNAQSFASSARPFFARFSGLFRPQPPLSVLNQL